MQTANDLRDLPPAILIRVRYLGTTDHRCSRWCATYKRSTEQTFRATVPYNDSADRGEEAALACLALINADRKAIIPEEADWRIVARAHDNDAYYYLASG